MSNRPNILLITADQMRWDAIGGRSICRTPNINLIGNAGVTFERSYTPVSLCCPARAMLLTGAYPWHNGVYHQVHVPMSLSRDLVPNAVTYAQRLKSAGYNTAYVGKWHASVLRGPCDLGYDEYRGHTEVCMSPECRTRNGIALDAGPVVRDSSLPMEVVAEKRITWPGGDPLTVYGYRDAAIEATQDYFLASRAADLIGELSAREEPWLIELHIPAPHDPALPIKEILDTYDLADVELPANYRDETFEGKPDLLRREAGLWEELTETDVRETIRHYWAFCEQVDRAIGVTLDALDASGQAEETLTVFTSDHGESLGAHRVFIKGWTPYEETHRIPMVARLPGVIEPGATTSALVQSHDWAHTFTALAGAEPLPYADGIDLTPTLRRPGEEALHRSHVMNVYYGCELLYVQRIAIGRRYKYVFNGFSIDELYDLEEDPGELVNLAAADDDDARHAQAAQQMRDALWEMMYRFHDPYTQLNYGAARYLIGPTAGHPRRTWPHEYLSHLDTNPYISRLSNSAIPDRSIGLEEQL